jgi:hypothetical protein
MRIATETQRAQRFFWCGLIAAGLAMAQPVEISARHHHWRGACEGQLRVDENGAAFASAKKKDHNWRWGWLDVQQLQVLDDGEIRLLTYKDNKWRLGADRELHFTAGPDAVARLAPLLGARLDRRFVYGAAEMALAPLWEIPVKHLLRFSGSEGTLAFTGDRLIYRTARPRDSRTWRLADIDNVSTSGPGQLTIVSLERARGHYGDRKGFNFELKQPLEEARYNELWRRLERAKGVQILGTPATSGWQ